jgi:hypothetical protein
MAAGANNETRYEIVWRNKFLTTHCHTIEEMAQALSESAAELRAMAAAGVTLDGGQEDDYARLVTSDARVARRFRMEESEFTE